PNELTLRVQDDGRGFAIQDASNGMGLPSMRARANEIGASLTVDTLPGKGCTVMLKMNPAQNAVAHAREFRNGTWMSLVGAAMLWFWRPGYPGRSAPRGLYFPILFILLTFYSTWQYFRWRARARRLS